MSVSGLCEICGEPGVDFHCDRCGMLVCDDHHDTRTGFCVECRAEVASETGVPGEEGGHDDVDTFRF